MAEADLVADAVGGLIGVNGDLQVNDWQFYCGGGSEEREKVKFNMSGFSVIYGKKLHETCTYFLLPGLPLPLPLPDRRRLSVVDTSVVLAGSASELGRKKKI